jgi:hypothetical protein
VGLFREDPSSKASRNFTEKDFAKEKGEQTKNNLDG